MKTKFYSVLLFSCVAINGLFAQTTDAEKQLRTATPVDSTLGWKNGGVIGIGLSQTSLSNWAAGGQNSVAINGLVSLFAHKKMANALWENYFDAGYGLLKQGNNKNWWKTDDKIDFTSKLGRKVKKNWYFAGLLNFRTQMALGYNYPNDSVKISNFLAPGYLLGALGLEYNPNNGFSAFIAPITSKITIVNDELLANAGAFGVEKAEYSSTGALITAGKRVRTEFGGYLRLMYKKEVMQNVTLQTRLDLFSNYLKNPQNIDVNWETLITLKVNKFISATLSTNLIYDDDVKISVDNNNDGIVDANGPRTQFKEVLNVGFSYKF